ncbi:MAG: GDSL-type esterase/lipase family protein [Pseudomonadota bacterium]
MQNDNQAVGMVDQLDSIDAGPTEAELVYAMASLAAGPLDPAALALATDPAGIAARAERANVRRARDWAQLCQYRDANAALAGSPVRAVFMGDSITELWALADPDLFRGGIVGRGISGQTSPQMLVRFMADVVAAKPLLVHLLCGTNDIAGNTGPSTPQDYKNNVQAMVALARANGIGVIIGSIPPSHNIGWASDQGLDPRMRIGELNAWLRDFANGHGLVWADYHAVLRVADDRMNPEFTRDGVHPTRAGYRAMRQVAQDALAQALGHSSLQ